MKSISEPPTTPPTRTVAETPEWAAFKAAGARCILMMDDESLEAKRLAAEALDATPEWQWEHREDIARLKAQTRLDLAKQENALRALQAAQRAWSQEGSRKQNEKRKEERALAKPAKEAAKIKVLTPAQLARRAQNERVKAKKDAKKAGS